MIFFAACLAVIVLISLRCWRLDLRRRRTPPPEDPMIEYRKFEEVMLDMIDATTNSREEAMERRQEFYRDNPPPMGGQK